MNTDHTAHAFNTPLSTDPGIRQEQENRRVAELRKPIAPAAAIAPVAPIAPADPHKPMSDLIKNTDALAEEYASVFAGPIEAGVRAKIIESADALSAKLKSLGVIPNTPFPVRP